MRISVIYVLTFLFLLGCNDPENKHDNISDFIPDDSEYILKINDGTAYKGELTNTGFLQNLSTKNDLALLQSVDFMETEDPFLVCCNSHNQHLIIYNKANTTFKQQGHTQHTAELKEGKTVQVTVNSTSWFIKETDIAFLISDSEAVLEKSISQKIKNTLKPLLDVANDKATASVFLKNTPSNLSILFPEFNKTFRGWKSFDIIPKAKGILLSGLNLQLKDGVNAFMTKSTPSKSETSKIVPDNAKSYTAYTFTNIKDLNLTSDIDSTIIESVTEIGFIKKDSLVNMAAMFSPMPENLLDFFAAEQTEIYRDIPLFTADKRVETQKFFSNFNNNFTPQFVTAYNNYVLFSDSLSDLQNVLNEIIANNTLAYKPYFVSTMEKLPENSSILMVSLLKNSTHHVFPENYPIAILQGTINPNGFFLNLIAEESEPVIEESVPSTIAEMDSFLLENNLITDPQLVTDYVNNSLEIAVQDVQNQLYLLNLDGKIAWKKQLDSPIQGKIEQIDIYNNGRLQLAFTTRNNFYIISRDGEYVKGFPVHFNDPISNPTAIFDYDLTRNYRFLITQKNGLYMVDKNGARISGFKLSKTLGNINKTPKHIRVDKKDYILLTTDTDKLYILDRQGQIRIPVSDKLEFSDNPLFWYNNAFAGTSKTGNLILIDEQGRVSQTTLPLQENHKIIGTSKNRITFSENILTINDAVIPLDFGDYTAPELFILPKNTYVSLTDRQTNKIHLFDIKGNNIEGFPVFGTGAACIGYNMNTGKKLMVVKGKDNEMILYKL